MYASQQRVRTHNLESVAALVRERGTCSRGEIGEELGLNKATVSSLVGELISRGLLQNSGQHPGTGPGRPRTIVGPDTATHVSLVVELLTDRVRLSSWTLAATPLEHRTLEIEPVGAGPDHTLRHIGDVLARWVRRSTDAGHIVTGIAVSVPGLVNTRTGTVVQSSPLQWQDVDVRAALQQRPALQQLPVIVERVANLATVAEWRRSPDHEDFVCLHGGETGLGVGVVTGGRLLAGANGRAGGLLFADNVAGRSATRLVARPAEYLGFEELLDLVRDRGSTFAEESEALLARLEQGDPQVDVVLGRFCERLGDRLIALFELFDPADVVLSGPLDPLAPQVIPRLADALQHTPWSDVRLTAGGSGPEASLIGAAIMLADRTFTRAEAAAA